MTAKERIKELIINNSNVDTIAELERILSISNGTINKWDKAKPSIEPLSKVADFFNVSVDYLLGRTENPYVDDNTDELNELFMMFRKNESDIPESKREEFRKDVEKYMKFVKEQLND